MAFPPPVKKGARSAAGSIVIIDFTVARRSSHGPC